MSVRVFASIIHRVRLSCADQMAGLASWSVLYLCATGLYWSRRVGMLCAPQETRTYTAFTVPFIVTIHSGLGG